jgi:hypothetical protein
MVARLSYSDRLGIRDAYRDAVQRGLLEDHWKRRWRKAYEYADWLSETVLPSLSMDQALALYRASSRGHSKEFRTNPVEEIRDSLDFLLYDTIKLESRFDECVSDEGAYKLAGAGKEFVSYLLCLRDPALFGIWDTAAEKALRTLGMHPETLRKGHWGRRYLDLLEALQRVQLRFDLANFPAVDQFTHWVVRLSGTL